jgi:hypothetical protein
MREGVKKILEDVRRGLKPPTDEEVNRVMAKRMFGKYADVMLKHAPWSFLLVKVMWKKGEEPWKTK